MVNPRDIAGERRRRRRRRERSTDTPRVPNNQGCPIICRTTLCPPFLCLSSFIVSILPSFFKILFSLSLSPLSLFFSLSLINNASLPQLFTSLLKIEPTLYQPKSKTLHGRTRTVRPGPAPMAYLATHYSKRPTNAEQLTRQEILALVCRPAAALLPFIRFISAQAVVILGRSTC